MDDRKMISDEDLERFAKSARLSRRAGIYLTIIFHLLVVIVLLIFSISASSGAALPCSQTETCSLYSTSAALLLALASFLFEFQRAMSDVLTPQKIPYRFPRFFEESDFMDPDVRSQGVFRGAERPDMDMMDSPDILDFEYFTLETRDVDSVRNAVKSKDEAFLENRPGRDHDNDSNHEPDHRIKPRLMSEHDQPA